MSNQTVNRIKSLFDTIMSKLSPEHKHNLTSMSYSAKVTRILVRSKCPVVRSLCLDLREELVRIKRASGQEF